MLKKIWSKFGHFTFALLFIAIYLIFNDLKDTIVPRYHLAIPLDSQIPFIKVFVLSYLLWFAYVIVIPIYLGFKSRNDFMRLCTFMALGQSISIAIYYLFPYVHNIRPAIMSNDMFSRLILAIYRSETATNLIPSIYVVNALAVHIALKKYASFRKNKYLPIISFVILFSIVLSTVFIKQNTLAGVFFGLLLGSVLYLLIYRYAPGRKAIAASANTLDHPIRHISGL